MKFEDEIALLIDARTSVIQVLTNDEERLVEALSTVCAATPGSARLGLYSWDMTLECTALVRGEPAFDTSTQHTPDKILDHIEESPGPGLYLLRDFHQIWQAKQTPLRKLRNLAQKLPRIMPPKTIIISTPPDLVPPELRHPPGLKHDIVCLELNKPDAGELARLIGTVLGTGRSSSTHHQPSSSVPPSLLNSLAETALGLSGLQARRVAGRVFATARRQDKPVGDWALDLVRQEKHRIIRESGALELVESVEQASSVGGLEVLREWLEARKEAFSVEAADFGLKAPRGVGLVGIPGTGKSLCAKVTAAMWRMPLLRLDMGAVFGGILGSSERNIRDAIEISELISPCVLWVDEIEKAFAGSGGDSGTAARVLGTFLTWMSEKQKPVCVLATANDVDRLPPEFLRKGRFDEVFFLDLPTREERAAILKVHLGKSGYSNIAFNFDLPQVVKATEGFVGAELEALVEDAKFPGFRDGRRGLTSADLVKSAGEMVPLAKSRPKEIERLRRLVKDGEARNASRATSADEVKFDQIRGERLLDLP